MLILWLALSGAQAQQVPELNAQLWRPPVDSEATLWADDAGLAEPGTWHGRAWLGYMNQPLRAQRGNQSVALVKDAMQLNLVGGVTAGRIRGAVDLPVYLFTTSDLNNISGTGLGDIALDVKGTVVDHDVHGVGFALGARTSFPTSSVAVPLGAGGLGYELQAIVDAKPIDPLLLTLNLGTRGLPAVELNNVSLNDQFIFRLGGGYAVSDAAGVSLDLAGSLNYSDKLSNPAAVPIEGLIGGWGRVQESLVLRGGLGTGLTGGIGAPLLRGVLTLSYEPGKARDTDLDGISDKVDQCPLKPEDKDHFEDRDGCPDPDNDGDGVLDGDDKCIDVAEDLDDYQDDDGCPDPAARVRIRITNPEGMPVGVTALIPGVAEVGSYSEIDIHPGEYEIFGDAEGYESLAGTFTVTEGMTELDVEQVMKPLVQLGTVQIKVLDPRGKPIQATWAFHDGFGLGAEADIDDGEAEMAQVPGDYSVVVRADGYGSVSSEVSIKPKHTVQLVVTLQPSKVKITGKKIEIAGKVFFDSGKASIQHDSYALLDEVAITLIDHPELLELMVEGHTDSRGSTAGNKALSERRAASVLEYLVSRGVERKRLDSVGYGEERPLDDREVPEAWEANRRVEFTISNREGDKD